MNNHLHLPFDIIDITNEYLDNVIINHIPTKNNVMGLMLCNAGFLEIVIESTTYRIQKGCLFFYTPSFCVHFVDKSTDFNAVAIGADYDYIIPLINNVLDIRSMLMFRDSPCIQLSDSQYQYVYHLISSLINRLEQENMTDLEPCRKNILRELVKSLGATLLYELLNIFFSSSTQQPAVQDRGEMIVQSFLVLLYQHYHTERDVAFYAAKQFLSPSYFSGIIKTKTGKAPSQWIVERIITDAKHILKYSALSIKEIAIQFNFPNQSFFGKYFKQYVGISPKEYRRQCYFEK